MMTYKKETKLRKHILVADDEGPLRRSIKLILRQSGYKVTAVPDGQLALKVVSDLQSTTERVDLVMTDLQMGGLTGMELLEELQQMDRTLPVLVMTGYGNKETVIELLRHGCTEYIDKPLDPQEVLDRISQIFARIHSDEKELHRESDSIRAEKEVVERQLLTYQQNHDRLSKQIHAAVDSYGQLIQLTPESYKLKVAYKYEAREELGGDFVDVSNTDAGCDVIVADVAGHDMGASYHTVLLKAFFDENCRQGNTGTAFFKMLNSQLLKSSKNERMITTLFLRYNLIEMTADVISAGHPPPIRLRKRLPVPTVISVHGDVLGLQDNTSFESRSVNLASGDRLFLYTDGVINAGRIDEQTAVRTPLGMDGLLDIIGESAALTLTEQVQAVWDKVYDYCRNCPDDDMLLVGTEVP